MFCDVETGFVSILFWRVTIVQVKSEDIAPISYKRNFQADDYPQVKGALQFAPNLWAIPNLCKVILNL